MRGREPRPVTALIGLTSSVRSSVRRRRKYHNLLHPRLAKANIAGRDTREASPRTAEVGVGLVGSVWLGSFSTINAVEEDGHGVVGGRVVSFLTQLPRLAGIVGLCLIMVAAVQYLVSTRR